MKIPVDSSRYHLFILQCKFTELAVTVQDSPPSLTPKMEHRKVATTASMHMAVHAFAVCLTVICQNALLEILDATFTYLQSIPYLIAGFYQAVADVGINPVGHHLPRKGRITQPTVIGTGHHSHFQNVSLLRFQQCTPGFQGEHRLVPARVYLQAVRFPLHADPYCIHPLIPQKKIQRSHIAGNSHILILRIEHQRLLCGLYSCRTGCTSIQATQQPDPKKDIPDFSIFHISRY